MGENSNDGERKMRRNKVWSANRVDLVCRKYKFSCNYLKSIWIRIDLEFIYS